jgi:hypothetical protein
MMTRLTLALLLLFGAAAPAIARGGQQPQGAQSDDKTDPKAQSSGTPYDIGLPLGSEATIPSDVKLICYRVLRPSRSSQQFELVPGGKDLERRCWDRDNGTDVAALERGDRLWIAIVVGRDDHIALDRIWIYISSKAAPPINVTPLRANASIAAASSALLEGALLPALKQGVYVFQLRDKLQGDMINTVTITGLPQEGSDIADSVETPSTSSSGQSHTQSAPDTNQSAHEKQRDDASVQAFAAPPQRKHGMQKSQAGEDGANNQDVEDGGEEDDSGPNPYTLVADVLPQSHSPAWFNISTALVYSTVHTNSFAYSSDTTPKPIVTGRNPIIDPVLMFTVYPWPLDTERSYQWNDDWKHPGISFGLSMTNPSSNFYFGLMEEFPGVRNLEIVGGFTVAKTAHLAPANTFQAPPSAQNSTPPTVQKFSTGGYIGLSFNVSGFLTSLFKGAGGGS